ncbi:TMEM175 family protein [Vulcaniibacterium gelatinicum]|uniref:TMEM175 family protein n=1 Tax=Vulcaniibacterium gelatinicum TaxID=2598725 RepID=UPI0015F2B7EC|nr:TMEM175 family protein [Vulcaniibacterium gelatinicum]
MQPTEMPTEGGFRLRGREVTRLETFVDAAFAFSLTLLVIFFNELPDTVAELREALRRVPTFAVCFVLLMLFWAAHNRWSRRFGLEDARSTVLSLALVLVYVYPLRMMISAGLSLLTGGWVPSELGGLGGADWLLGVQTAFMVYAAGFGLLAWLIWRLNAHALAHADALALDACERYETATEIGVHRIMTGAAALSLLLSLVLLAWPPTRAWSWLVGLPMWVYAVMGAVLGMYGARRAARRAAVLGAAA